MTRAASHAAERADAHENSAEALEHLRELNTRAFNRLANRLRKTRVPATPAQLAALVIHATDSQKGK